MTPKGKIQNSIAVITIRRISPPMVTPAPIRAINPAANCGFSKVVRAASTSASGSTSSFEESIQVRPATRFISLSDVGPWASC